MKKLITIIFLMSLFAVHSQKRTFKFGKITDQEMAMESCEFYPDAKSTILGEYGVLRFDYHNTKGWQYKLDVVVRVKIFDITDADQGNIVLRLYDPIDGANSEELAEVKSNTYNLINGVIEKHKINRSEVFKKRINDYWVQKSFAVPKIKAGTVFEYSYSILSDYIFNLTEWTFQKDIPSFYSEFDFTIPQYFNYQSSLLGNNYNLSSSETSKNENFTYTYSTLGDGGFAEREIAGGAGSSTKRGSISSISKRTKLVMTNIEPINEEPHQTNISDIPSRVEFQLISTNFPWQGIELIASSYESFNKEILTRENFGRMINSKEFTNSQKLNLSSLTDVEKAVKIYDYHRNHFNWNGYYSIASRQSAKEAYSAGEGNVADINLSLIAALRSVEIEANPVILSTRGNGTIHPVYPSFAEFNYVIGVATINGKSYLMDAASEYPFGVIPLRCRNGKGWIVSENGGQMIDMMMASNYKVSTTNRSEIREGKMVTSSKKTFTDYAATEYIKEDSLKTVNYFSDNLSVGDLDVKNISMTKMKGNTLEFDYKVSEDATGELYFQPIKEGTILENPFKREKRSSIIDFPYMQTMRVVTQITIPDGYIVELPEPARINLPNKKGSFSYLVNKNGNTIIINSTTKINSTSFGIDEYPQLRQFYQMIADKNNELVVLSR